MVLPEVWPGSAPENHFLRWNAVLCRAGCGILTMIERCIGPAAEDWSLPASGRRVIIWYRMLGDQRFFERKITAPRALQFTSMGQEAIPISSNEMRKIHRGGEGSSSQSAAGRKVNVSQSRREQPVREPGKPGKAPKEPKEKAKHPILRFIGRTIATLLCLGIMAGSLLAVGMVYYVVQATANDGVLSLWLLLYGLLSADPVALPVLGWFLPASSGRANSTESPSAASFGLPAAGVAGAKLADAISAPPAGDLRRADGGVPVAAPGRRSALKNSAKGS